MPSTPVSLVEKGVLKDFLRTRLPMQGFPESNGHALLDGTRPAPTNLIITTTDKSSPMSDMQKNLIDLVNSGVAVRRHHPESWIFPAAGTGAVRAGWPRRFTYIRVYADGHEEMIRRGQAAKCGCAIAEGHSVGGR